MLDEDKKVLASLIREYDFEDIVVTLIEEVKNYADHLSDLGLKEKSTNYYKDLSKFIKNFNL